MSWCDKLSSTPTVAFKLDPNFTSSDRILDSLSPVLNQYFKNEKATFNMDRQDTFSAGFATDDGFNYFIEPNKIVVSFKHRMRIKPVSAGPPVVEMLSEPAPFTHLLPEVIRRAIEVASLLPHTRARMLHRISIVTTTITDQNDMPPGVKSFIKYLGRPWSGGINNFSIQISASLHREKSHEDRCTYNINKPDETEDMTTFAFDWQRQFDTGRSLSVESLTELMRVAERASLTYFEKLAVGDEWDEQLIGNT